MKKFLISLSIAILSGLLIGSVEAMGLIDDINIKVDDGKRLSNNLFSFVMPKDFRKMYTVKKTDGGIFVYDKISKKSGFGGFAFGIKAYEKPSEHAMMPGGRKIGELVDKKGIIYDMVLIRPTDVQYDYVNKKSESYDLLYEWGESPAKDIRGVNDGIYYNRRGTLGEGMYDEILKKHVTAIKEKWDSTKLEKENMSYMYNVLAQSDEDVLDKIGYIYYDTNADGIDELLIGEIADGEWKGIIYDMYTMVDRAPKHVVSGGSRDRYFVCDDTFICNEGSSGANESVWLTYVLVENSTELFPQVGFKYDGDENKENPWFISYDINGDKWENVDEKTFSERKLVFETYERFNFIPLSNLKY